MSPLTQPKSFGLAIIFCFPQEHAMSSGLHHRYSAQTQVSGNVCKNNICLRASSTAGSTMPRLAASSPLKGQWREDWETRRVAGIGLSHEKICPGPCCVTVGGDFSAALLLCSVSSPGMVISEIVRGAIGMDADCRAMTREEERRRIWMQATTSLSEDSHKTMRLAGQLEASEHKARCFPHHLPPELCQRHSSDLSLQEQAWFHVHVFVSLLLCEQDLCVFLAEVWHELKSE